MKLNVTFLNSDSSVLISGLQHWLASSGDIHNAITQHFPFPAEYLNSLPRIDRCVYSAP